MKIDIGTHDRKTRTVRVTFEHDGVTHTRAVNACYTERDRYDRAATEARVADVGAGVAAKIAAGAIRNDDQTPES